MTICIRRQAYQRSRFFTILLFIFIVSLLSAGCSKNDDGAGGDYYMKFTVNGVAKEYRGNTLAQFSNPGYEVSMVALNDAMNASDNMMSVVLNSETSFTTNTTYTEAADANGDTEASLIYNDELGNVFTSLNPTLAPDTKVAVQFTAIASGYVKGTFSGKLYDGAFSAAAYTITNGSFYLKRE